jgi:gas vesicle protein
MDERNTHPGAVFAGILVGGLVGAGVALLTAPRSGEETRSILREKGTELKERGVDAVEQTRTRAVEMRDRSREAISEKASGLKNAFQEFKEGLTSPIDGQETLEKRPGKAAA